ncbi:MAG: PRC-barrel domain-containing protein [Verrucomicrobiota bacterium]|jgi:sporulation protein YlmC with PRC-barrel domain
MKRKFQIITSASAASLLAFSALAQETLNPKTDETASPRQHLTQARSERLNGAAKATDIIGMTVNNYQNERLGNVEDLAVDVESGRIVQVILSTGGFPGMGNTFTAVPPGALRHDAADKVLHLNASKAKLAAALKFDTSKWDKDTQSNRVTEVYGYYGEKPYFVADNDGYRNANLDGTVAATLPHNMDGSINTEGARTMDKANNVAIAGNLEATNNWISTRNPDGTWTREYYSNERRANNAWSRLGYVQKASRLMGTPVKNLQDQKLGKVENLMVDVSAGRIVAVIISSGGYIGLGDELSAVPPTALRFNAAHDTLQLDASKDMLANSPHFKANRWPDFSQPGYAGGVYHAYNVVPYFSTTATTDADNTRPIVRDRVSSTLTTLNQGNRPANANTAAQIRQEINADSRMSVNAKNVKITAIDGRVILCGPVNSAEEKRLIGEIANRIAHAGNVDNQLEVQITTNSSK